eukprot:5448829-Pleurochrysis_carterae.AAC.1
MQPAAVSDWHEWALIHVVSTKDTAARLKARPRSLLRRQQRGGACGEDPMCPYDALCVVCNPPLAVCPSLLCHEHAH